MDMGHVSRFPAPRPGKISQEFVDHLRKVGASARLLRDLAPYIEKEKSMEEITSVELNYAELCALLESGTVQPDSALYEKLKVARDRFTQTPKVYGRGYLRREN